MGDELVGDIADIVINCPGQADKALNKMRMGNMAIMHHTLYQLPVNTDEIETQSATCGDNLLVGGKLSRMSLLPTKMSKLVCQRMVRILPISFCSVRI